MRFRAIHQLVPYLSRGDAVGNHVLDLRRLFKGWGYASEIFAPAWHATVAGQVRSYRDYDRHSHPDNLLIFHYATGSEVTDFALGLPDRVALYYHNITPAHFYLPYSAELALLLEDGRRDMARFAGRVRAIAVSPYNARELEGLGIEVVGVVPCVFGLQAKRRADPVVTQALCRRFARPGSTDWLHVGRLAPNKCLEDVIKAFYYYHAWINPASRLLLVGNGSGMDSYVQRLNELIARLQLKEAVVMTGPVEQTEPFYRLAQVYVTMSEHEGFCIPLLEAMQHSVPIVAFASSAVPETLGGAGILIRRKEYPVVAEVVTEVLADTGLRERIVAGQRARLAAYSPLQAAADLRACLERLA